MALIVESVEVAVPLHMAYLQWTAFEEYPLFMHHVQEVRLMDSNRLQWKAELDGEPTEWESELLEVSLDRGIAWRNPCGPRRPGVGFINLTPRDGKTQVSQQAILRADLDRGSLSDLVACLRGNLQRLKELLELRFAEESRVARANGLSSVPFMAPGDPRGLLPLSKHELYPPVAFNPMAHQTQVEHLAAASRLRSLQKI